MTMTLATKVARTLLLATPFALAVPAVHAQQPLKLLNARCTALRTEPVTETTTGRTYLLDYPCDLKAGDKITFILNLHGGGSSGTWQRQYFPASDFKEQHRLVIASPYSPTRSWSANDDAYLQNIVTTITDAVGRQNVQAFWLVGHSQGGATSRRIVCSDFFKPRVDGFLSLSGGRVGGAPQRSATAGRPAQANETPAAAAAPAAAPAAAQPTEPSCDFSHIYETGEHEIAALPAASVWAQKYHCGAPVRQADVVDTKPGQVHDGSRQNPGSKSWGLLPRPGTAHVFVYPNCGDGKVVADVMRMDKGHTEGLEPMVTEALIKLMRSARGGKIQKAD